ncbi:hypothetical protein [Actinomyces procaprae]|uniref:hypothetical protein n=1 Tax=Actinomyces procaprae TaxID=2560010 RepID=UPI0010A20E0B|nr:hypothetical protein [Actinomyces procaprae]
MTRATVREWMGNVSNADDERCLLVLPGLNYPAQLPGLYLPMRALSLEGWKVFHGQWELADLSAPERRAAVSEAAAEFVCRTAGAGRRLIMAKSLGRYLGCWLCGRPCDPGSLGYSVAPRRQVCP